MCTAISFKTNHHYFGRTLDLEYSYEEQVVITPRNYAFQFRNEQGYSSHYAIIGMAYVQNNYPLYYDATNEMGLSVAGLNFPGNAMFYPPKEGVHNIAAFELIPWILGVCKSAREAKQLLEKTNITDVDFSLALTAAPLHWMISDREQSIVVESTKAGLQIYDNPIGVLTNNPPFDYQMSNLSNYVNLTAGVPTNRFLEEFFMQTASNRLDSKALYSKDLYSKGLGAFGLPGDWSSASRFVRAAFVKVNSVCGSSPEESISQFFHILDVVGEPEGCVRLEEGKCHMTVYTSWCDTALGVYYYTTYGTRQISAVDMRKEALDSCELICFPLIKEQQIKRQN